MKKYFAFFLLLSVTALVYGRPQKLVIKTDKESVELRYWPLDGKQLPFYSLYSPVIVTCRQMTEIELPCNETIYKISLGKGKTSLVYATAGAVDTVSLYRDSVYFSGHNQTYNLYLEEAEKADEYCRSYSYTRNHPLAKVQSLAIFKTIVADRKAKDEALLNKGIPVGRFMLQQQRFIDLRYKALFLKKAIALYASSDFSDDWMNEFKAMDFHFMDSISRQSGFFPKILEDYVFIKSFVLDGINPKTVDEESVNTFLFEKYCHLLSDKNLEYVVAYLLYNDIFQKRYSKDIPSLYDKYIALFPDNPYIKILLPEVAKISALYHQKPDNDKIQIVCYETEPEDFTDMMRPFAGKVVYIDIWATTCSPCIQSFSNVAAMKQHFPDSKDIVLLYPSIDRDERHEKWNRMINYYNLEGYHYRVNKHTSKIIYSAFKDSKGILTIPRYVIVDKNGKIAFMNAASPSNPIEVTKQLQTLL